MRKRLAYLARESNDALAAGNLYNVRTCSFTKVANGDLLDLVTLCVRGFYRVLRNDSENTRRDGSQDDLCVSIDKHRVQPPKFDQFLRRAALLATANPSLTRACRLLSIVFDDPGAGVLLPSVRDEHVANI